MKARSDFGWMFAAVAVVLLAAAGCSDDKKNPTGDEGISQEEIETAATVSEASSAVCLTASTTVTAVGAAVAAFREKDGGDTLVDSVVVCPDASVARPDSGTFEITLDFGESCTSPSGYSASGQLKITYERKTNPETISVAFESFSMEGLSLDGTMTAYGTGSDWVFTYDGSASGLDGTIAVTGTYSLTVNLAGTPTNTADDSATVDGAGTVAVSGKTYDVEITEPLAFSSGCALPLDGTLNYQQQANVATPTTTIDFETGDCCTATVSVANQSEDVNFCTLD